MALLWRHPEWRGAKIVRIDPDRVTAGTGLAMKEQLFSRGSNSRFTMYQSPELRATLDRFNKKEEGVGAAWVMFPVTMKRTGKYEGERTLLIRVNYIYDNATARCCPVRLDWIGEDYSPRLLF